jgi:hypothetical protein
MDHHLLISIIAGIVAIVSLLTLKRGGSVGGGAAALEPGRLVRSEVQAKKDADEKAAAHEAKLRSRYGGKQK